MISVIIPYWETYPEKKDLLQRCIKSLPNEIEKIVVWNNGMGYAPAINRGCMVANGDYFLVMNDDVFLKEGDLNKLCVKDTVVSPSYEGRTYPYIWGSCFCVPSNVWQDIGGMDERYTKSYFDDDHLIMALLSKNIKIKSASSVVFGHSEGSTMDKLPDRNTIFEENKQRFINCWGAEPSVMYRLYEEQGKLPTEDELLNFL